MIEPPLEWFDLKDENSSLCGTVLVPHFSIRVTSVRYSRDAEKLTVSMEVPDRDDPRRGIVIDFNTECPATAWDNEALRPELVRQMLRQAFNHEIDENIYVNESRMYDPHILQKIDIRINEAAEAK